MSDIKSLEHPTLKVPYEHLNKKFRSAQKIIDREVSYVQNAVTDVEKALDRHDADPKIIANHLEVILERLGQLKSRSVEAIRDEQSTAENCKTRLAHLKHGLCSTSFMTLTQWRKTRIDRMLVEHFLRGGFYRTAVKLAKHHNIEEFTNISIFLIAKEVEEALMQKDMSKVLSWCHDNKSKLRKMKSSLEYNVRLQEYVELIKANKGMEAVRHSRKHLATDDPEHLIKLQKVMGLLAFPKGTKIAAYKELMDENRWQYLIKQFREENFRLYSLSNQSMFSVTLQAGLSALKTPQCYSSTPDRGSECPVCQPGLNKLAEDLPMAHCAQSKLICHVTGKPMDDNDPPMSLPNGYVYSETAITNLASETSGDIICPRTQQVFSVTEADKVYVL